MASTSGEISSSIPQHFPLPSRSLHAYDTNTGYMESETRFLDPIFYPGFSDREENTFENDKDEESHHSLRKFVKILDEKGHEMLKKLGSKDVTIERLFRETLHDLRGTPISDMLEKFIEKINSREVKDDTTEDRGQDGEEMLQRLERFKVKAVNIAGIGDVKEDEEH